MEQRVQRFPWFDTVPTDETIWKYKRAIEGHKFILVDFGVDIPRVPANGEVHAQIYEGHVFTHWGSFPGIYDQATLRLVTINNNIFTGIMPLNHYECKEFTLSMRNTSEEASCQFLIMIYFYEIPMSKLDTLEYAVRQPRYKYRHGSARTLDRFED